ncbi:unnamed protein product [Angiostrongylus costaricensis]|uniref:Uncharacterized protein n=1 Tax=Angiostrongylus costaricensis TaxID=334426 RepID=A0A0R3PRQ2_ANGCS|nr:unnamed protein product [Angiostrongylus costaricensis]
MELLPAALRSKQNEMFARMKKCATKEHFCALYLEDRLWRRIVGGSQEEMDKCFELLNEQSEYIKFTREKPRENWPLFLDAK